MPKTVSLVAVTRLKWELVFNKRLRPFFKMLWWYLPNNPSKHANRESWSNGEKATGFFFSQALVEAETRKRHVLLEMTAPEGCPEGTSGFQ